MKWDLLTDAQFNRLCDCRSIKADIVPIAKCFKAEKHCSAFDAVILALEHLDSNNQYFDLTEAEFNRAVSKVG